jgi:hypothetical protein
VDDDTLDFESKSDASGVIFGRELHTCTCTRKREDMVADTYRMRAR